MTQLPLHLIGLSKSDLEDMCVDCGLCCYASAPLEKGSVLIPDLRCKHLDFDAVGKSCCDVYENRHDVMEGWCLPLAEGILKGIFPDKCPYVAEMKDYVGSAILSEEAFSLIEPQVRKSVLEQGKPPWVAESNWTEYSGE